MSKLNELIEKLCPDGVKYKFDVASLFNHGHITPA